MTKLTYTIAHIRVGAGIDYEEIKGFLSNDLETLYWYNDVDYNRRILQHTWALLQKYQPNGIFEESNYAEIKSYLEKGMKFDEETIDQIFSLFGGMENPDGAVELILQETFHNPAPSPFEQNPSQHPLSPLANEIGAKIYGGFEDEKDFYVVMPTYNKFKVGDIFKVEDFDTEIFAHNGLSFFLKKKQKYRIAERKFLESFHEDNKDFIKYNLFQEYAKTGVIENELYKQFFE